MFDAPYTRRGLLRQSVATAVVASSPPFPGCSRVERPLPVDGGSPVYTDWLPVPEDLNVGDHYQFIFADTARLAANEESLGGEPDGWETVWHPVDLDWDETTVAISIASGIGVVAAEFDRDDLVGDLEDANFEDDTDHEGYTIYRDSDEQQAVGVGDGTLVVSDLAYGSPEDADPVDRVRTVIDTNSGDMDRYTEADEDMQTLVDTLDGGDLFRGRTFAPPEEPNPATGDFEHAVARGTAITIDGETSAYTTVVVFETADDALNHGLSAWVHANDGVGDEGTRFDDVEDITITRNGRAGVIEGTIDTDVLYA